MNAPEVLDSTTSASEEVSSTALANLADAQPAESASSDLPPRPAWIEIDLKQLHRNFQTINQDKPKNVQLLSVVKDEAYGHGALQVAGAALSSGASFLALVGTPHRYGQNWAHELDLRVGSVPLTLGGKVLAGIGGLTGYAGGLPRKELLLRLEGSLL